MFSEVCILKKATKNLEAKVFVQKGALRLEKFNNNNVIASSKGHVL